MVKKMAFVAALALGGCMTQDEGEKIRADIRDLKAAAAKNDAETDAQLKRLRQLLDEATKVVTRNSADVGGKVDKLVMDTSQLSSRMDDTAAQTEGLIKQFQEYRAATEAKLEQLNNAANASKQPPLPETADGLMAEGDKRMAAAQYLEARRAYDALILKFPQDARAAKAQYQIGESYYAEKKFPHALQAYKKVIDFFPKSDLVQDSMYKSGLAFYSLKYCGDAKIFFQELLRRYPKTSFKKDAGEQLKKLTKDAHDKNVCAT